MDSISPNKKDKKPRLDLIKIAQEIQKEIEDGASELNVQAIRAIADKIEAFDISKTSKTGGIVELRQKCLKVIEQQLESISAESPSNIEAAQQAVIRMMPTFIYYSNYGNLDGQIYLPRIIEDLKRKDLSDKEVAKVRTLKVLFEYLKLKPNEILELGRDLTPQEATDKSVESKAEQKRERTVLLDSAGDSFTRKFSDWWKQGNYVFQFRADGDHFKIWVSDAVRTEKIELENRSSGLQWFFSFFLVFLNERHDTHEGSILLLDEPGVTLHPMAQKDLFAFFEGLSIDNQILYTTHSPFLMDPDKLDQVKAVYVNNEGYSCVSTDLRARANSGTNSEQKAIFPVHSALGITVSEVLFVGCTVVLVEGPSDQYYLNAIKNILIGNRKIFPTKELLFVPAGGTRGIKTTSRILSYDEESYPFVLLDGDAAGRQVRTQLEKETYEGRGDLINSVTDYVSLPDAEIEDLVDPVLIARIVGREFRGKDDFEDKFKTGRPIIPQIKDYCKAENIEPVKGWKVDIAREVKKKMMFGTYPTTVGNDRLEIWVKLFSKWIE